MVVMIPPFKSPASFLEFFQFVTATLVAPALWWIGWVIWCVSLVGMTLYPIPTWFRPILYRIVRMGERSEVGDNASASSNGSGGDVEMQQRPPETDRVVDKSNQYSTASFVYTLSFVTGFFSAVLTPGFGTLLFTCILSLSGIVWVVTALMNIISGNNVWYNEQAAAVATISKGGIHHPEIDSTLRSLMAMAGFSSLVSLIFTIKVGNGIFLIYGCCWFMAALAMFCLVRKEGLWTEQGESSNKTTEPANDSHMRTFETSPGSANELELLQTPSATENMNPIIIAIS